MPPLASSLSMRTFPIVFPVHSGIAELYSSQGCVLNGRPQAWDAKVTDEMSRKTIALFRCTQLIIHSLQRWSSEESNYSYLLDLAYQLRIMKDAWRSRKSLQVRSHNIFYSIDSWILDNKLKIRARLFEIIIQCFDCYILANFFSENEFHEIFFFNSLGST